MSNTALPLADTSHKLDQHVARRHVASETRTTRIMSLRLIPDGGLKCGRNMLSVLRYCTISKLAKETLIDDSLDVPGKFNFPPRPQAIPTASQL